MGVAHHLTTIGGISSVAMSYCLKKESMNLNSTKWLVEMNWKNFEEVQNFFDTVLRIWQNNSCGTAAFSETLHAAIIFQSFLCLFGKWLLNSLGNILQPYSEIRIFVWYNIKTSKSSQWEMVLKSWENHWKLSWIKFTLWLICVVSTYSSALKANPSFPQVTHLPPAT